jgi:acetoin utilization deacetylase AcuC-like enzyme
MRTFVFSHPDIFKHDAAARHGAMAPDRIARIYDKVAAVPNIALHDAQEATAEQLERNHTPDFVSQLKDNTPTEDGQHHYIDGETVLNRHTWRMLSLSAGAACQAVDAVKSDQAQNAFCVTYAGHHAKADTAGGFCFLNPVAIAARHALAVGFKRVAVLDIDTHSGNGTVLSLMDVPRVMFAETFQEGYPGTYLPGFSPENIHRKRCDSPEEFRRAWTALLAEVEDFNPSVIIVSAGFDAHRADPLGTIGLCDNDYRWVAREILAVNSKVVACLEGGYNVEATARCAAAFVEELTYAY